MKAATSSSKALSDFLTRYRPALVILSGEARGMEYRLDQPRTAVISALPKALRSHNGASAGMAMS